MDLLGAEIRSVRATGGRLFQDGTGPGLLPALVPRLADINRRYEAAAEELAFRGPSRTVRLGLLVR